MKQTLIFLLIFFFMGMIFNIQAQTQRSINENSPTRQVHLDFHTSEFIPGIGEKFDKKQFQEALKAGRVNQINIFSKGHHGWSYYPTRIGHVHPNLNFDLLGAQIEACHEIGVKCPVYFTIGWSVNDAEKHPEWCIRKRDGSIFTMNYDLKAKPDEKRPHYSWKCLCPATSGTYHQNIMKQVEELCQNYKVDGFWFDIYHIAEQCYCEFCTERMKMEGIDLDDPDAVSKSMNLAFKEHMKELRLLVGKYHPKATVYFNATTRLEDKHIFKQRLYDMNTHQDLEDLPTTWGGYDKLPLDEKYHLGNGVPVTGMSGKFHKAWGEFGGFKHPDAIKYEAAAMISFGASCNFGDQLHPSGEMDMETYRNIGEAYQYIEKIEDYGPGGIPVSKLGMWLTLNNEADHGVANMLLEIHQDFVIASEANLGQLELLVIPSHAVLSQTQADKINRWVQGGGKLIVFADGAMNTAGTEFILEIGAEFQEKSAYDFDYTVIKEEIGNQVVTTPFLNYESGLQVMPLDGKVLASIRQPYFSRTYEKYSSHRETPYQLEDSPYTAIVRKGNVIFFSHQLDQLYYQHGVRMHRQLFQNAIDLLYEKPLLKVSNLPSSGRISLLKQEKYNRYIVHLLYAPALTRGEVRVIEDFLPVPGVEMKLNLPEKIKKIHQVPNGEALNFEQRGGEITLNVPTFTMHTGIVLEY